MEVIRRIKAAATEAAADVVQLKWVVRLAVPKRSLLKAIRMMKMEEPENVQW